MKKPTINLEWLEISQLPGRTLDAHFLEALIFDFQNDRLFGLI